MQQPTKAHFDQTHNKTHCRYIMYMYQNTHDTQLNGLKKILTKLNQMGHIIPYLIAFVMSFSKLCEFFSNQA